MPKAKIEKKPDEVVVESAASETLHPDSGSNAGAAPRAHVLASIAGALANVDREKCNVWAKVLKTNFKSEFGTDAGEWAENKNSIKAHASDAVGKAVKEDIADMFKNDESLTEEFRDRATVVFEAAVNAKVNLIEASMEDAYEDRLQEEVEKISETIDEKVGTFLNYVAEQWAEENKVAIESALRAEITTEFMTKLRDLFIESNINIPEDQVDVVDTLSTKVEELEARLAEQIQENAALREGREADEAQAIIEKAKEGMTEVQKEKLAALAEGVEASSAEEFTKKVGILAESVKGTKPTKTGAKVQELLEEADEKNKVLVESNGNVASEKKLDPSDPMARYLGALARTVPASEKQATA